MYLYKKVKKSNFKIKIVYEITKICMKINVSLLRVNSDKNTNYIILIFFITFLLIYNIFHAPLKARAVKLKPNFLNFALKMGKENIFF